MLHTMQFLVVIKIHPVVAFLDAVFSVIFFHITSVLSLTYLLFGVSFLVLSQET